MEERQFRGCAMSLQYLAFGGLHGIVTIVSCGGKLFCWLAWPG